MRALVLLIAVIAATDGSLSTSRGRSFKGGAQDFRALSLDGRLLLAAGTRRCGTNPTPQCHEPVLTVYRTGDAKKAAELVGPQNDYFYGGAFDAEGAVTATTLHDAVRWDPGTGQTDWQPLPKDRREIGEPTGRVASPDGSIAATIRAEDPAPAPRDSEDASIFGPATRSWLAVTPGSGTPLTLELLFPERPTRARTHWAGARMHAQFAEAMAISPDLRWIAIGYGVRLGDSWGDTQARIAIFALADGRRAGWIDGARYRRNILLDMFKSDSGPTDGVPLGSRLAFSPDGTVLYGTSLNLFGVDVSGLR